MLSLEHVNVLIWSRIIENLTPSLGLNNSLGLLVTSRHSKI
jgi:hypothetical protein